MPEQLTMDFPYVPVRARLRIVSRASVQLVTDAVQLAIDFVFPEPAKVARRRFPIRDTVCASSTLVTLDGVTMPAAEWAVRRGLKWQTVKMRRMRGDNWKDALGADFRRKSASQWGSCGYRA